jgi:hypothetical protein
VLAPLITFSQAVNDASPWVSFWGLFSFALMIFIGVLMNCYFIRYLHIGRFMSRNPWMTRLGLVILLTVVTPYFGQVALSFMFLYILSPIVTWRVDPEEAARETRHPTP